MHLTILVTYLHHKNLGTIGKQNYQEPDRK